MYFHVQESLKNTIPCCQKSSNVYIDMRESESIEYDVSSANHSTRSDTNSYDNCFQ